jgi:hypothetical protein
VPLIIWTSINVFFAKSDSMLIGLFLILQAIISAYYLAMFIYSLVLFQKRNSMTERNMPEGILLLFLLIVPFVFLL